jgi:hypothetical protein
VNAAGAIVGTALGTFESGSGTGGYWTLNVKGRVAPNTPGDTYRLQITKGGNATFAFSLLNGNVDPSFKSWMAAFVR